MAKRSAVGRAVRSRREDREPDLAEIVPESECPTEDQLERFALGELDEAEDEAVDAHLLTCTACCDFFGKPFTPRPIPRAEE